MIKHTRRDIADSLLHFGVYYVREGQDGRLRVIAVRTSLSQLQVRVIHNDGGADWIVVESGDTLIEMR